MKSNEERYKAELTRSLVAIRALEELACSLEAQAEAMAQIAANAKRSLLHTLGEDTTPQLPPLHAPEVPAPSPSGTRLPSIPPIASACDFAACDGSGMRLEGGAAVPCACGGRP